MRRHCFILQRALLMVAVAAAVFTCRLAFGAEPADAPLNVVVLYSGDMFLPATVIQDRAMREAFNAGTERSVNFYAETLHAYNLSAIDFDAQFISFMRQKYLSQQIDLILAGGTSALNFLERHRPELWPTAPAAFFSVDEASNRGRKFPPGLTGLTIKFDPAGTLDFAIRLQPKARRVVVVTGASEADHYWVPQIQDHLQSRHPTLPVTYLTNQTVAELAGALGQLPAETIVLYTTVLKDAAGKTYVPRDVAARLSAASTAPIYGLYVTMLGHGIMGGVMPNLEAHGRSAGQLGLRLIAGEKPDAIPVLVSSPNVPMVDWRQLRRWGISEKSLPPGCTVAFRPTTFWENYQRSIIVAGGVITLQTALILALLAQRRHRQRMELELHHQRAELVHASRLAIVGELTASIAHEINQPLGAILSNADAADMLLETKHPPLDEVRQILTDIRKDDLRASQVVQRLRTLLRKREVEMLPLDLNEAVSEVLRLMASDARQRGITVDVELGSGLPGVQGDKVHLQQVLLNLMVNGMDAMADLPETKRRLIVRTSQTRNDAVEVLVMDAGPGIPPDHLPRLFESFYTTKKEGMGLGLSIARSIIEAHHGRIWAENNPDGGAAFRFTLPAKSQAGTRQLGHG